MQKIKEKMAEYKLKKEDIHRLLNYATKVPSAVTQVQSKVKNKVAAAIAAAFAFVIALVWRDLIRSTVDEIVLKTGMEGTGYIYTAISALFVTVICVMGIMFFSRWSEKK